jgi:S1-C subfamily serine protease
MKAFLYAVLILSLQFIIFPLLSINSAYLGVYLEDMSEEEKNLYDINHGVRIDTVIPDSPADREGLQTNDIILRINDMPITLQDQVRTIIRYSHPGDIIEVEILSNRDQKNLNITLGDLRSVDRARLKLMNPKTKHIGVKLQYLSEQLKEYFQIENGVLIAEVRASSPADSAGLKAGDVIVAIEEWPINRVRDVINIIESKDAGDLILIDYVRNGDKYQVEVEITETEELFSFDLNNEIIFLGNQEIDVSEVNRWFESVFSDSTQMSLEEKIKTLQKEINRIRRDLFEQKQNR